jgi:REP element-mobilizing transposase RayT
LDDNDRSVFLERFSKLLTTTATHCFAWALIPNHFHLLLQPTRTPLSHFMRRLSTGYAVVFNKKHKRSGHLFQNRYKSIVCEEEQYLMELVRYIHLNPLRAGLVTDMAELDQYPWSGHSTLMGNRLIEGQETKIILERFGNGLPSARQTYRQFVSEGVVIGRRKDLVGGGLQRSQGKKNAGEIIESFDERILGSGKFVEALVRDNDLNEKIRQTIPLSELISQVCKVMELEPQTVKHPSKIRRLAEARGVICFIAVRKLGIAGGTVGKELCLGPTGVSIAIRRGEKALMENLELYNDLLRKIEK